VRTVTYPVLGLLGTHPAPTTTTTTISYDGVTHVTLNAGNNGPNTVNVQGTAVPTSLVGGTATSQIIVGANGSVKNVRSSLTVNGSSPQATLLVEDSQATTQDAVTVTPTQVGAGALDQFFGAGGSLTYNGISALTLNLSHAADDTVQLTPSVSTAFFLQGDPTEFSGGHGALLNLDLTGVLDALLAFTSPGSGTWTFGNRKSVVFQNMNPANTQ
jgi:hypothetical protein